MTRVRWCSLAAVIFALIFVGNLIYAIADRDWWRGLTTLINLGLIAMALMLRRRYAADDPAK